MWPSHARWIHMGCHNIGHLRLIRDVGPFVSARCVSNLNTKPDLIEQPSLLAHQQVLHQTQANFQTSLSLLKKKSRAREPITFSKKTGNLVTLWKNMSVREAATAFNITIDSLFEFLIRIEHTHDYDSPSSKIDRVVVLQDLAKLCKKGYIMKSSVLKEEPISQDIKQRAPPTEKELLPRHPVVTIMGHVDHGKTTLLDYLRKSSIVDGEFGGITQHIGAFEVALPSGEKVTFLDTPGHAAFSAIRERGANMTDIIVLVVASEDGVMPQTKECIEIARKSAIPLIVAINKVDMPNANVPRTREMLTAAGVQLETAGGDVQGVEISALKGINIDSLVETLVTEAEVMNLRADSKGLVEARVVESRLDAAKGKVATCLIQRGTLQKGDILVAGHAWAKVRNMVDEGGRPVKIAGPSTPVQVIGWRELPSAGEQILEVKSEGEAKKVVAWRQSEAQRCKDKTDVLEIALKNQHHLEKYIALRTERRSLGFRRKMRRKVLESKPEENTHPRLSILLKGDVDGSVEAILDALDTYDSRQCDLDIIGYGVGPPTESELAHVEAFNGIIYAFNITIPQNIRTISRRMKIPIRETNIIYRLVEHLKKDLTNTIPATIVDEVVGEAEVLEEFLITIDRRKVPVAGCRVNSGSLKKALRFKVIREGEVVHEGTLESMKHHKNEVASIKSGTDCGIQFRDQKVHFVSGDQIVCYEKKSLNEDTDWEPPGF